MQPSWRLLSLSRIASTAACHGPASAAEPAFAADSRAAPDRPASSAPSYGAARTPVRLSLAPPLHMNCPPHSCHTVPLCTCLRCPTETHFSQWCRTWFVTLKLPMSVELECGGGLSLLCHVTRRDVVYFYSGVHRAQWGGSANDAFRGQRHSLGRSCRMK